MYTNITLSISVDYIIFDRFWIFYMQSFSVQTYFILFMYLKQLQQIDWP